MNLEPNQGKQLKLKSNWLELVIAEKRRQDNKWQSKFLRKLKSLGWRCKNES